MRRTIKARSPATSIRGAVLILDRERVSSPKCDTGAFDSFLDSGGPAFATGIDASHGFKAFNGVNITIPGFTWTDMVFEIQMNRQGGKNGDSETDTFEIKPGDLGATLIDKSESDSPDDLWPSSST